MRESNFNFPITNKACVSISSALYDRRALDCTAVLPLVNSLWNLGYLTLSSARIREIMTTDGGLERLVRILRTSKISKDPKDTHKTWKWLMAYHCVINIGVRGTEQVRKRVVQTGAISIIYDILEAYLKKMEVVDMGKQINQIKNITNATSLVAKGLYTLSSERIGNNVLNETYNSGSINQVGSFNQDNTISNADVANVDSGIVSNQFEPLYNSRTDVSTNNSQNQTPSIPIFGSIYTNLNSSDSRGLSTARNIGQVVSNAIPLSLDDQRPVNELTLSSLARLSGRSQVTGSSLSNHPYEHNRLEVLQMQYEQAQRELQKIDNVMFRPEDVAIALQLLAYVSKYSEVRETLHCVTINSSNTSSAETVDNKRRVNVFALVEKFTFRNNLQYMQGWAGIIMTNMCRKDDKKGGIRKCANVNCPKWETTSQPFAKCRRCRKAKYCSRECQSVAWAAGHKNWCSERVGSYDISENTIEATQPPPVLGDNLVSSQPTLAINTQLNSTTATRRTPRTHNTSLYSPYHASRNQNNDANTRHQNDGSNTYENVPRAQSLTLPNSQLTGFGNLHRLAGGSHQLSQFGAGNSNPSSQHRTNINLQLVNAEQNNQINHTNAGGSLLLPSISVSRYNTTNNLASTLQESVYPQQQPLLQNAQADSLSFRNYNSEHFNNNTTPVPVSVNRTRNTNIRNIVLGEQSSQPRTYNPPNNNYSNLNNTSTYRNNFGSNF